MRNCSDPENNKKDLPNNECNIHSLHHENTTCHSADIIKLKKITVSKTIDTVVKTAIKIKQMDCPTEEALIQKKLSSMPVVKEMEFNLIQRILHVTHQTNKLDEILAALNSLGFKPKIVGNPYQQLDHISELNQSWWPLAIAVILAIVAEIIGWANWSPWLAASAAIAAILLSGLTTYKKGWISIKNGNLNINALMSIAVTGAFILQQWPEAAMVMVLFSIAELIEAKSLDHARNAMKKLMQLTPDNATVQQADGSWLKEEVSSIEIGRIIRVKPGERISLDGQIINGQSSINQAPITGESLPIEKSEGDTVFAATINLSGSFDYQTTATSSNTALARIIHAVEQAQSTKAPTQRFVDRFARIYTPIVFFISLTIAILPPLLMGQSWFDWIYKALVLLVIACPCALVISTPVTIVSGLAAAARQGILIKGGIYLEKGRKLKWLALDKTGTITHGKPVQTNFELLADSDMELNQRLATSLTSRSDHPVSKAVNNAFNDNLSLQLEVNDFETLLGRGVKGTIAGKTYHFGNHRLVEELGRCSKLLEDRLNTLEKQGKTVVMLINEQHVMSLFAVADTVKGSSQAAINELHELGVNTIILTGDNYYAAQHIAQQVNIDEVRGNQLPEDKLNVIETFRRQGIIGMVGDGINDAPALASADIGFSMAVMGTDIAIETADVALMDDNLKKIPIFIRLSKKTHSILLQNILLALSIKAVFLVLILTGLGTMWMAVFADVGASLLIIVNGLRLLKYKNK